LFNLIIGAQLSIADQKPEKNSIKNILPENFKYLIAAVSVYGCALNELFHMDFLCY
jgi:hypothetical protein